MCLSLDKSASLRSAETSTRHSLELSRQNHNATKLNQAKAKKTEANYKTNKTITRDASKRPRGASFALHRLQNLAHHRGASLIAVPSGGFYFYVFCTLPPSLSSPIPTQPSFSTFTTFNFLNYLPKPTFDIFHFPG